MTTYSYIETKDVQELTGKVGPTTQQMLKFQDLSLDLGAFERSFDQYLLAWDYKNDADATKTLDSMLKTIETLKKDDVLDKTKAGIIDLEKQVTSLKSDYTALTKLNHNTDKKEMNNLILKVYPAIVSIREKEQALLKDTQKVVEENIDEQIEITDALISQFILLGLISAVIAILLSIIISVSISRPIIKLRNTAAEIGKGNLDIKADIKSQDEVGELAATIDDMTKKLKQSKQELQDYGAELEKKVAIRTMELKKKLEDFETKKKK